MFSLRELLLTFTFNYMRVHLIRKQTLENYVRFNARSAGSLQEWLTKINRSEWNVPADIKRTFNSADLLGKGSNRVIFDLGGNNYRMICKYAFGKKQVHLFIAWIGTHAEYDKVCKEKMQFTINIY